MFDDKARSWSEGGVVTASPEGRGCGGGDLAAVEGAAARSPL